MGRFISIYAHACILLVYIQMLLALYLNACPDKLMWTLRAKQLCGVKDKYMCLYDTNEHSFRELCKDGPEFHRPGNIFVISGNLQYFAGRQCNGNRYQPHKWWTNGSSECQYIKSSCNGEGQIPYDNGTISSDRKCRCDYTNYYTFVNRTRNKCHCDPIEEDCSCYRQRCNEDQVLTPDYGCVGVHQWTGRYVCPEYKQPKNTDDNKMQQITICPDIEKDVSGTVHQSHARIAVTLTSGVLMILGLMTTIAFLINRNTRQDLDEVWSDLEELKGNLKCSDLIKKQIEEWEKKDKMFVSTRASDYVMEQLQDNSCLTLTAPSGVGKSFIARHTALLLKKGGYNIIPVYSPTDIRDYYQPGKQTVFIVDDICGNFTANQQQIENWKQMLPVINTIVADKCCKIIVSCRLQVYKDEKFNILLPFKFCECNLISDKLCLTSVEKTNIAKTYIGTSMTDIDDLSFKWDFFPLLCSLYHETKYVDVKEYFKKPFDIYKSELDKLSEHGDEGMYKICSLVLCVLFNNQLKETWFHDKIVTNEQRNLIEDTCDACNLFRSISKAKLKKAIDTLDGTFICKENGTYSTVHKTLFDFLVHYFGQRMIECLIDHGDSDLVKERFIWQKSSDDKTSNLDFIIEIPDGYLESYLKRFIKDWSAGKVTDVFSNNNIKVSSFRQQLLKLLLQLDESQQVALANTKDTVIPRENSGSGNTPLVWNCFDGYTDMVQWLLLNVVNVDQCRDDGTTGLIMASRNGYTDIVRLLLEKNPNVDLCDKDGCSPLYMASKEGHTNIVKVLLDTNPNVDQCDNNGCSPLYMASKDGHTSVVKLLLEKNPNVDQCDNNGCSPLDIASQNGHTDIVKLLLRKSN